MWLKIQDVSRSDVEQEPILSSYYYSSILSHKSLESALVNHLPIKLSNSSLPICTIYDLFMGVLAEDGEIMEAVKDDLGAVKERDPACISCVQCLSHSALVVIQQTETLNLGQTEKAHKS